MEILRIVLTILFVIDCIGLTVIILMQEGKSRSEERRVGERV